MAKKSKEERVEELFDEGLDLMRQVMAIQDKLYEVDEIAGEKFNEAITDESFLRS
jgi:hypothetical protein